MTTSARDLRLVLILAALGLAACTQTTDVPVDVSEEIANLAAEASQSTLDAVQASQLDEAIATGLGVSSNVISFPLTRARSLATARGVSAPTVVHTGTDYSNDTVTITKSWIDAHGVLQQTVTVRPEMPSAKSWAAYTAAAGAGSALPAGAPTGVQASATGTGTAAVLAIAGTETLTADGSLQGTNDLTWTYRWDETRARPYLAEFRRAGEVVGLDGNLSLTTRVFYLRSGITSGQTEAIRVLDYLNPAKATVKRQVALLGVSVSATAPVTFPATLGSALGAQGTLAPTTSASSFRPAYPVPDLTTLPFDAPGYPGTQVTLPAVPGTYDVFYWSSDLAALSVIPGDTTTYPTLDYAQGFTVAYQAAAAGVRVVDDYRPATTGSGSSLAYLGTYYRRYETSHLVSATGDSVTRIVFDPADGQTVKRSAPGAVFKASSGGSLTTTRTFSDGKTTAVKVTPTVTGFTLVRSGVTYQVKFDKDAGGNLTRITVTNGSTGTVTPYIEAADGTWTKG